MTAAGPSVRLPGAELLGSATRFGECVLQRSTDCGWTGRYTMERTTLNTSASELK